MNSSCAQSTLENDEYRAIAEAEVVDLPPNLSFSRILQLAGPKSPLESQMFSVQNFGNEQAVKIDPNSVNSVLLNPYQQVIHLHITRDIIATINNNNFIIRIPVPDIWWQHISAKMVHMIKIKLYRLTKRHCSHHFAVIYFVFLNIINLSIQ